ncbi:MAG: ROK family protein, partial [Actinobacteria bacterium]|nr:ROK family protein [Actinomycetota bacterium]
MIVAVFRRKLKPGKTIEDFTRAWEAEKGFGVPARVFTATSLSDPSEILTVGFVDLDPADLEAGAAAVAEQEQERHERIADVIESTELREFYALG